MIFFCYSFRDIFTMYILRRGFKKSQLYMPQYSSNARHAENFYTYIILKKYYKFKKI